MLHIPAQYAIYCYIAFGVASCMDNTRRNALLDQASGLSGCDAG